MHNKINTPTGKKRYTNKTYRFSQNELNKKKSRHLSDASSLFPDLENTQNEGYGARGAIELVRLGDQFNWSIEAFIRFWHIDDSELSTALSSVYVVTGLEPENESTEAGIKLGMQF